MNYKIKKFFPLNKNKAAFGFVLFFVLGLFCSLSFALAEETSIGINPFLNYLLGVLFQPATILIFGISIIILLLSSGFAVLSSTILGWVISPNFISLSYTNPANNKIIEIGFSITQGLANVGIFLALVFIALATILRIKDYQAQKTLPTLIIIALLINFAPVIAGVIVDASNIVMQYLLGGMSGPPAIANKLSSLGNIMVNTFGPSTTLSLSKQAFALLEVNILSLFNAITGFVLLIFAFLFSVRYVAIWLLVILSPLAFIARVLKDSKQYWDMWWQQLIQWSIIGVIGSFFLYIAEKISLIITGTVTINGKEMPVFNIPQNTITGGHSIIENLFVLSIPIIFLFIGLMLSFQTSAIGGSQVVNWSKGIMATAGKKSWSKAKPWLQERTPQWVRQTGQRLSTVQNLRPNWGQGQNNFGGWLRRRGANVVSGIAMPATTAAQSIGRSIGPTMTENERKQIDEAEKNVIGQRFAAQAAAYTKIGNTDKDRIGIINAMIKDKNIGDALAQNIVTVADLQRLYQIAQNTYDKHSVLRTAFPIIAADNLPAGANLGGLTPLEYVLRRIKTSDYQNITQQTISDDNFIDTILNSASPSQVNQLIEAHQRTMIDRLEERLTHLGGAGIPGRRPWLETHNPRLAQYFTAGAGQGGINIP